MIWIANILSDFAIIIGALLAHNSVIIITLWTLWLYGNNIIRFGCGCFLEIVIANIIEPA